MRTQNYMRNHEFQPNIPLLDREFDAKSPEIADFIISHAQDHAEDFYFIEGVWRTNQIASSHAHRPQ